jgi:hypothetical protein
MRLSRRDVVDAVFVFALFAFVVVASLLRVEFGDTLQYKDGWWYLSRAWQHTHGVIDNLSFYTLAYPLLVGAINWLVYDLPVSGMIANAIILLFMAFGIYLIGRLFFSHAVALLSVFIFMLNGKLLYHVRMFNADLLFMAAVTWMVIVATLLVRTTRRVWAVVLAILVGVSPYIRFESYVYGALILLVAAIFYKRAHGFQALARQALFIGFIVGLLWMTYAVWFLSGADDLGGVADAWSYTPANRFERLLGDIVPTFSVVDWTLIFIGVYGFLRFIILRKMRKSKIDLALKAVFLVIPIALVVALVTFTAPIPDVRYAFFVLPCLAVIYSVTLSKLYRSNISLIASLIVLALYAFTAVLTLETLPAPMAFQSDARAVATRHALHDIQSWKHENGYQDVTIRTICSNLMIFAQFDIRLPFTGLSFSSQRFAPPGRALPEMAARSDFLLTCARGEIIGDLKIAVPYWVDFYEHLNATPVLSENDPLEEVGRIGEYRIYRVKPEVASKR